MFVSLLIPLQNRLFLKKSFKVPFIASKHSHTFSIVALSISPGHPARHVHRRNISHSSLFFSYNFHIYISSIIVRNLISVFRFLYVFFLLLVFITLSFIYLPHFQLQFNTNSFKTKNSFQMLTIHRHIATLQTLTFPLSSPSPSPNPNPLSHHYP